MHHADRIEDVRQDATQLPVAFVVHRLEIDLVAIGPAADVIEDLGRGVAVGDERRLQTGRSRGFEHVDRPLGRDQRLIVRGSHHARALAHREAHELVGSDVPGHDAGGFVAQRLRGQPVLAIPTVEVAAQHAERERVAAGQAMEEGLFFGGIALQGRDVARRRVQRSFLIESHLADPAAARLDETAVTAGKAANRSPVQSFDELRFPHTRIQRLRQWHVGRGNLMIEKRRDAARSQRTLPGVSSYRRRTVRTSRSDSSRTLAVGNMMSVESFE